MNFKIYIPFYKKNLKLAIPVIFSQVGQVTVSLVDNMMVGHSGTTELAAASFSNSIFIIGMLLGMGMTMGMTPLVGKYFSRKDETEVGSYLKNGLFLHAITAILIVAVMTGVAFLLGRMGQPEEVSEMAFSYFLVLVASIIPLLIFYSCKQFLEGMGNTKVAMVITLSSNLVNIVLNYLLIFGKYGFPEMGLLGAGVATFISRLIMPFILFAFMWHHTSFHRLSRIAWSTKLEKSKIRELFNIGFPIGTQIVVEVLTFSVGAVMMGWIGKEQLAAHQVAIGMASFTYMISLGVGAATTIHVSHEYGVNNFKLIRRFVFTALHLIVLFMSTMGILFVIFRHQLPHLFTNDAAVIRIAAGLLIIAALFQIFDGIQVALLSCLRGLSDVKMPMFLAFLSYSVVGLPISYLCAFVLGFGAMGVWMGFLVGLASAAALFAYRLRRLLKSHF
ncbi:MATE family efflux transporter [Mangrovibacterium diazotrophicum]|uniref:Multidrug-efflux transporter n=1 Tax=Mangrovibacterium diazotrophicum TaxID=1261403 RepID=A0A419W5J7_9BACT|nr:MATE family efflux transporter [Mangrovibacterium diazotrophicum]RKD90690.1 MATE family multidrug resistance protein [Mangrovibacterium diazotrophicum]